MKKTIIQTFCLLCLATMAMAQKYVTPKYAIPEPRQTMRSFAIITDKKTWKNCRADLLAYQQQLGREQLPTFIVYKDWRRPEEVKQAIARLYTKHHLEGVVFIGDVPIAMIRQAQHLTSAFKMNEETFPWRDASVPSDRFYDDFSLKFDFLKQDSVQKNFFYYNLAADSPQQIHCDIYSARIKPVSSGKDPYRQISDYLQKAIVEHQAGNSLDQFFSYTGDGSYSNSLTAWTAEAFTLREQFPGVFDGKGRARFMRYNMFDYPKNFVINMMKRDDLDLAIFHEHGTPDRQYISASPPTTSLSEHIEKMKLDGRSFLRRKGTTEKDVHAYYERQRERGLDSTWFAGYNDPKQIEADSLLDLQTGIVLTDVTAMKPNARMTIFDACYNGDFREDDYIAGRYIFSDGKAVAAFANSVNVLQDKMANDMLGLLGMGARIGQWAQLTNILESHVIGDPTLRFTSFDSDVDAAAMLSVPYDERQALQWLDSPYADIQNMAMYLLYHHGYQGLSRLLADKYRSSSFWMVRYTAISLLEKIGGRDFEDLLKESIHDPYEFIRRSTVNWMGDVGRDDYLPLLVKEYAENYFSERERFDIGMVMRVFDNKALKKAIDEVLSASYVDDKDDIADNLLRENDMMSDINERILNTAAKPGGRKSMINSLKNSNMHMYVPQYVKLLLNPDESDEVKVAMLQALAWFTHSVNRQPIIDVCRQLMNDDQVSALVRTNALRTYNRLK